MSECDISLTRVFPYKDCIEDSTIKYKSENSLILAYFTVLCLQTFGSNDPTYVVTGTPAVILNSKEKRLQIFWNTEINIT